MSVHIELHFQANMFLIFAFKNSPPRNFKNWRISDAIFKNGCLLQMDQGQGHPSSALLGGSRSVSGEVARRGAGQVSKFKAHARRFDVVAQRSNLVQSYFA